MSSLNLIGGEKGGVGKSVLARLLAQYFIDMGWPFTGFDTDRSHTSFLRFYSDFASPVVVDHFEGLDRIVAMFDTATPEGQSQHQSQELSPEGVPTPTRRGPAAIVDLAAQTAAPLARWVHDSELLTVLRELGVTVNFWHVADAGPDSIALLERLIDTYGPGPNYIIVRNEGRGSDFSQLDQSAAMQKAHAANARVITLPALHEASMRKIERANLSFWAAANQRGGADALGLLERQRVKSWLKQAYAAFDLLPL